MTETRTAEEMAEIDRRRAERFADRDVSALVSLENFDVLAARVLRMLPPGQRFSVVQEYLGDAGGGSPDIYQSTVREEHGDGVRVRGMGDPDAKHKGLTIYPQRMILGFGFGTTWPTERAIHAELARMHEHRPPREKHREHYYDRTGRGSRLWQGVTYVDLTGGLGDGPSGYGGRGGERLAIVHTNENGVSTRTLVIPEWVSRGEQAEREKAVLDRAAAILDNLDASRHADDGAADLRVIAERNCYHHVTLDDWAGPVDGEARADAQRMRDWRQTEKDAR